MPKFFVGQRVRILYSLSWPELKGLEGRVTATGCTIGGGCYAGRDAVLVAPDIWGTAYAPYIGSEGGNIFAPTSDQLEPILPEGHKAGDFSYEKLLDHLKELSHEKVS